MKSGFMIGLLMGLILSIPFIVGIFADNLSVKIIEISFQIIIILAFAQSIENERELKERKSFEERK
jgi:hypothetical protein